MHLSEAFMDAGVEASLELKVKVHNISQGRNKGILGKSKSLWDYAEFIGRARELEKSGMELGEATKAAVKSCIKDGIMKDFLETHGSEVANMLYTEFNLEDAKAVWKEEAFEEGLEKGIEKGIEKTAASMIHGGMPWETVSTYTGLSMERIKVLSMN